VVVNVQTGRLKSRGRRSRSRQHHESSSLLLSVSHHARAHSPPPLLAAINTNVAASSSRTPSPERPLPKLTVIPPHHQDVPSPGFPAHHQPDVVTETLGWKLVPDEFRHQTPRPPSLIYGAHHLLRLFGQ